MDAQENTTASRTRSMYVRGLFYIRQPCVRERLAKRFGVPASSVYLLRGPANAEDDGGLTITSSTTAGRF